MKILLTEGDKFLAYAPDNASYQFIVFKDCGHFRQELARAWNMGAKKIKEHFSKMGFEHARNVLHAKKYVESHYKF